MAKKIEIGPYSAYAIAVKHGYTGTEEQWVNETNKNMTLAQAAATDAQASKEAAEASKSAAAQSAIESANSATAAQASETAAANSENNAQASAEAAARSAEEAKSAASTDKTLTIEGSPADAKATGDALAGKSDTSHTHDLSAMINDQLSEGTATPQDADYYISQYVGGGTETTTYHRRPLSSLWNWIKAKLGSAAFKTTRTLNSQGPSGWANLDTDSQYVPDMAFMAYWNGAYSGGSSNLAYCNKGAFGNMATYNARLNHNTSDTWMPVFSNNNVDYILKNEIGCSGFSISAQTSDPGAGSGLTNNRILIVYE